MTGNIFVNATFVAIDMQTVESAINVPEFLLSRLFIVGISYHKADARLRSLFSMNEPAQQLIVSEAKSLGIRSIFTLSTCNRSEIYGFCNSSDELIKLFTKHTAGSPELFEQLGFILNGKEALHYMFKVASGLDSQIVGDYEILGQLKNAISFSRNRQMIGPIMDRTLNFAFQASKSIKTQTLLSNGTVSVSYAAVEWLQQIKGISKKNITLIGTGKIGRNVIKNLKHYLNNPDIHIINRTNSVAAELAENLGVHYIPYQDLQPALQQADVIVVCTSVDNCWLGPEYLPEKEQWLLDLSVPQNIDPQVGRLPGKTLTGIDEVSTMLSNTINKRKAEIPKALNIIDKYETEYVDWLRMYRHIPMLNDIRAKLTELGGITSCELAVTHLANNNPVVSQKVNKTVGELANNLRYKKEKGCHYINAINSFLQPDAHHP